MAWGTGGWEEEAGFGGDAIGGVEIEGGGAGDTGLLRGPSAFEHLMTTLAYDEGEEEECLSFGWVVIRKEGTEYAIDMSFRFPLPSEFSLQPYSRWRKRR